MNMKIEKNEKLLIVAPHPDDEAIGCGGLLTLYGNQCDVLLLTDGRKGYLSSDKVNENDLIALRKEEFINVMKMVNIHSYSMLSIPDGEVQLYRHLISHIDITEYNRIFVPNHYERHKDHSCVYDIFKKMLKKQKSSAKLFEYEVWSPISAPNYVLDCTNCISQKIKIVNIYQSQIKYTDYIAMTEGLNKYRGAGFHCEYAEVYYYEPQVSIFRKMYHKIPLQIRRLIRFNGRR